MLITLSLCAPRSIISPSTQVKYTPKWEGATVGTVCCWHVSVPILARPEKSFFFRRGSSHVNTRKAASHCSITSYWNKCRQTGGASIHCWRCGEMVNFIVSDDGPKFCHGGGPGNCGRKTLVSPVNKNVSYVYFVPTKLIASQVIVDKIGVEQALWACQLHGIIPTSTPYSHVKIAKAKGTYKERIAYWHQCLCRPMAKYHRWVT